MASSATVAQALDPQDRAQARLRGGAAALGLDARHRHLPRRRRRGRGPAARQPADQRAPDPARPGRRRRSWRRSQCSPAGWRSTSASSARPMRKLKALAHRVVTSQEEERARVSRELHDHICQLLVSIKYRFELVAHRLAHPGDMPVDGDRRTSSARCPRRSARCAASRTTCAPRCSTTWACRPRSSTGQRTRRSAAALTVSVSAAGAGGAPAGDAGGELVPRRAGGAAQRGAPRAGDAGRHQRSTTRRTGSAAHHRRRRAASTSKNVELSKDRGIGLTQHARARRAQRRHASSSISQPAARPR